MITTGLLNKIVSLPENKTMIKAFLRYYRNMSDEASIERLSTYLIDRNIMYIPSNNYLNQILGEDFYQEFGDYIDKKRCILSKNLVIPLLTLNEDFLGFILNNPTLSEEKYRYPVKGHFDKSKYFQMTKESLTKALERGYIFIVEGVFDELSISSVDEPCCGLSGSSLTWEQSKILDIVPTKIILSDEDKAGRRMFLDCRQKLKGKVIQARLSTKDIDEYLRVENNAVNLKEKIANYRSSGWAEGLIKF